MSIWSRNINELDLVAALLVALLAMLLLFDHDFGLIYISMVVVWFVFYIKDKLFYDKKITFPVEQNYHNRIGDILLAFGIYAGFLLISSLITNTFAPGTIQTNSIYGIISTMSADLYQASTPILQDSVILMVLGWALIIPIIETSVTGKLFEAGYDSLTNKNTLAIVILCLIIGAGFAVLHLTSKAGNSTSLMITFIFFSITAGLIYYKKDLWAAIWLHIFANATAVLFPLLTRGG
jgi:membrane protease YdiL (CAAX protease family)